MSFVGSSNACHRSCLSSSCFSLCYRWFLFIIVLSSVGAITYWKSFLDLTEFQLGYNVEDQDSW